jgi:Na+/H+ antiporter NhaD/arsenite permease-like protein
MTTAIICTFITGYLLIAMESLTKVNKSAVALLMAVICWTLFYLGFGDTPEHVSAFTKALGETSEILFFLMGAMVIVETVDTNGGFSFVREKLISASKVSLLWKLTLMTFFLSAVLDNMTTAIVMVMILDKLIPERKDKMLYASMVILAANSGGAFSPIGDVTTIMLWVKGNVSTFGIIRSLFLPSLVSVLVPALIMSFMLKGRLETIQLPSDDPNNRFSISSREKAAVFAVGVGGLLFVPVFRFLTGLPPFMGILLVLALIWMLTEMIFKQSKYQDIPHDRLPDVSALLHKIDLSTILFFLGILTTVAALSETGALKMLGTSLDKAFDGNPYFTTSIIGILSAVVDNVPLVASCMGMYDVAVFPEAVNGLQQVNVYGVDGTFWELLAYCAGIGGSLLIIGSAAGVVVMGLQKISFGWYMKNFTWIAALGYLSGILTYSLQSLIL